MENYLMNTDHLSIRRICASDWKAIQAIWEGVNKTEYAQYDNPKDITDETVRQRIAKWGSFENSLEHMFFGVFLMSLGTVPNDNFLSLISCRDCQIEPSLLTPDCQTEPSLLTQAAKLQIEVGGNCTV